jgi:hypothetical protein
MEVTLPQEDMVVQEVVEQQHQELMVVHNQEVLEEQVQQQVLVAHQ